MQQQVERQEEVEREGEKGVFVPYGYRPESGDCAESDHAKDVAKEAYKDEFAFKVGTRTLVKHAP